MGCGEAMCHAEESVGLHRSKTAPADEASARPGRSPVTCTVEVTLVVALARPQPFVVPPIVIASAAKQSGGGGGVYPEPAEGFILSGAKNPWPMHKQQPPSPLAKACFRHSSFPMPPVSRYPLSMSNMPFETDYLKPLRPAMHIRYLVLSSPKGIGFVFPYSQ